MATQGPRGGHFDIGRLKSGNSVEAKEIVQRGAAAAGIRSSIFEAGTSLEVINDMKGLESTFELLRLACQDFV